ncbi:MAG: IS630 family transposase [Euryarchaeota archaeon]|nr:IS630 family transposase [Euryarchaeota archaeon]
MELYERKPEDGAVLCFDEKGTIAIKEYGGESWSKERRKVLERQEVKETSELLSVFNPHSKKVLSKCYERKTSIEAIDFLKEVRKETEEKIYLILDNWSVHRSKAFKEFVEKDGKIELVYLPTNTPWLNRIEQFFSALQRDVINNSNYKSKKELEEAIARYVEYFNSKSQTLKCDIKHNRWALKQKRKIAKPFYLS